MVTSKARRPKKNSRNKTTILKQSLSLPQQNNSKSRNKNVYCNTNAASN
jgi:hypothetical protein